MSVYNYYVTFGDALEAAKDGWLIYRAGWRIQMSEQFVEIYVGAYFPERGSEMMTKPFFYVENNGERMPWLPCQADMFAQDWRGMKT